MSSDTNEQLVPEFNNFGGCQISQVRADILSLLLGVAGLLHDADPLAVAGPDNYAFVTVVEREWPEKPDDLAKPLNWTELVTVTCTWHMHAVKRLAEAPGIGVDEQWAINLEFDGYCSSTVHDQHLQTNHLLPYLWVEASGVNACESGTRVPGLVVRVRYGTYNTLNLWVPLVLWGE